MSNQIELRHLRYFRELSNELHFRKAAEKLYISQPGLSRQIKMLEEEMGIQLLERSKKNVRLTRSGSYFKEETEFILNHLDQAIKHARSIEQGKKGEVRIGFVGSAMFDVIPDLLLKMKNSYPGLTASLEELSNQLQVNALLHDELDIGFLRAKRLPSELSVVEVKEETFSLVLHSDHPTSVSSFSGMHGFQNEDFIMFSPKYSPEYYHTILSICEDAGFRPQVSHKSVHAQTIFKLVANKLGVAIIPTSLSHGHDKDIKFIELKDIPQRTTLYVAWKENNRNPALRRFLKLLEIRKA